MYKWKIVLMLRSGKEIECIYGGTENTSVDVIKRLINDTNNPHNRVVNIFDSIDGTGNIAVLMSEVVAAHVGVSE